MRWVALLVLGIIGCMADDEMPCTIHHDGRYYDLNPLTSNKYYELKTPGNNKFVFNVCKRPAHETFGLKDVNDAEIGGFVRRGHGDFSIGASTTNLTMQGPHPQITLTGGSRCKSKSEDSQIRASTAIEFVCDTSVDIGTPRLVAQLPPGDEEEACAFFIEWRTRVACPTSEPGAWGFLSFIAFLLMSLAVLYLVSGILYNRFILHLRGADQIPKFSLESMKYHASEAFDWIKDLTSGSHPRHSSYASMPSNDIIAPLSDSSRPRPAPSTQGLNPASHQTQVMTAPNEGDDSFARPQFPRIPSIAGRKVDINPISHQAQVSAQLALPQPGLEHTQPLPPPIPVSVKKERPKLQPFDLEEGQTPQREFLVGDDDEDDLGSARSAAVPPRATSRSAQSAGSAPGDSVA